MKVAVVTELVFGMYVPFLQVQRHQEVSPGCHLKKSAEFVQVYKCLDL